MARPSKYKAEYCQRLVDHFSVPPQQVVYKKTWYANGVLKSEEPVMWGNTLPTFQGFAASIGTTAKTLLDWCGRYPAFREAYARAKELQEHIWLVNAMGGQYNAQFAQFFGKNCLGYKDKVEAEVGGGGLQVQLTVVDKTDGN